MIYDKSHSTLIVGGTAEKRRGAALLLAQEQLGQNVSEESIHPDLVYLSPQDEAGLGIDQIRQLVKRLAVKPSQANAKVALLEEAQRATTQAQNALLKTLEEPPSQARLILTCSRASQLLTTVVSRCRVVELPTEVDLPINREDFQQAASALFALLPMNRGERLAWVESNKQLFSEREGAVTVIKAWISALRDVMHQQYQQKGEFLHANLKKQILEVGATNVNLQSVIRYGMRCHHLLITSSVNSRICLEAFLLQLPVLE